MRDLYGVGLRRRLLQYLGEFLKNRSFRVKIDQVLSTRFCQETRVPQGGVLSVTLFALKIRQITGQIALGDLPHSMSMTYRFPIATLT